MDHLSLRGLLGGGRREGTQGQGQAQSEGCQSHPEPPTHHAPTLRIIPIVRQSPPDIVT